MRRLQSVGLVTVVALVATGCSSNSNDPYQPSPAWSGKKASLPAVPSLPSTPIQSGDAYTVYGSGHHLRSLVHNRDVTEKDISIVGYIVETNIAKAPACAVHKTGKADPKDCEAPLPLFVISDVKGETKGPRIQVVGWAGNFANIYDAMEEYKKAKPGEKPKEMYKDQTLGADVPYPLPAVGAKVKITGSYGFAKSIGSGGTVADPVYGVLAYKSMETLEPAPEPAAFAKK